MRFATFILITVALLNAGAFLHTITHRDEPRLLVVTNYVRSPIYVTNTVTTIREVPAPSQPYYSTPLPYLPSHPVTDTNFWQRAIMIDGIMTTNYLVYTNGFMSIQSGPYTNGQMTVIPNGGAK
jgi:hypothetical protein